MENARVWETSTKGRLYDPDIPYYVDDVKGQGVFEVDVVCKDQSTGEVVLSWNYRAMQNSFKKGDFLYFEEPSIEETIENDPIIDTPLLSDRINSLIREAIGALPSPSNIEREVYFEENWKKNRAKSALMEMGFNVPSNWKSMEFVCKECKRHCVASVVFYHRGSQVALYPSELSCNCLRRLIVVQDYKDYFRLIFECAEEHLSDMFSSSCELLLSVCKGFIGDLYMPFSDILNALRVGNRELQEVGKDNAIRFLKTCVLHKNPGFELSEAFKKEVQCGILLEEVERLSCL